MIIEILDMGPVWLGPVLAAGVFVVGWYVLPAALADKPSEKIRTGQILVPVVRLVTPYATGLILFM